MRFKSWATGTVTLLSFVATAYVSGCLVTTSNDCELKSCGSEASSGTGGDGGMVDPKCIPSEATGAVADTCGIFASSSMGDDANPGTQAMPVKTIAKAIELANSAQGIVYSCAQDFEESVVLTSSVQIYGGLDCANGWGYVGDNQKTRLMPLADVIPLRIESGINTTIQDVHVLAATATATGGSSIAVIADGATAKFVGCTLEGGDGAAGQPGQPISMAAAPGENGVAGNPACSDSQVTGPEGMPNICGSGMSLGGTGGTGGTSSGLSGGQGEPALANNGGAGASGMTDCSPGSPGEDGDPGTLGADAFGLGSIDSNGYTGPAGGDGTPGTPGQGGGGGGGSKGGSAAGQCALASSAGGASGGSGASGGCGGLGGRGGGAGGASIAVISISANLTFESTQIVAKLGGAPGAGGTGQDGGAGGPVGGPGGDVPMGSNLKTGCAGGRGGAGGKGGTGGNGLGGHSIGIAFIGTAPTLDTATTFTTGTEAAGGVKADMQQFQ